MAYKRITWLASALRAAGITVVEHDGWKTRGLSEDRPFEPNAVVWHHDASPVGDSPGVPAYIIRSFSTHGAQVWVDRAGRWHLLASGRAAHAGEVRVGAPTNATSVGIETDHTVGEAWPAAQLQSLRKGTAVLLKGLGVNSSGLHFHKTICDPPGRKIDPAGLELLAERSAVQKILTPPKPAAPAYPGRPVRPGDRGAAVAAVQRRLKVDTSGGGLGVYGPRTLTAVKRFQRVRPWLWPADGVIGPKTWAAIFK